MKKEGHSSCPDFTGTMLDTKPHWLNFHYVLQWQFSQVISSPLTFCHIINLLNS